VDIQENYEEVRSIVEASHCCGCEDWELGHHTCDFDERVNDVMKRLLQLDEREGN
jgi:hypothetical protein